jgi:predicted nucleic acid-binding protein
MARLGIDALVAIRLAEEDVTVSSEHRLVAPSILRSEALAILYRSVRAGERSEAEGLAVLRRIASLPMRVLGDRMSRQTAWRIAADLGWDDPRPAEYLAVTRLQADAFVALDPVLLAAADGVVPIAPVTVLLP